MKRNIKSLLGFTMGARDGEIGKVRDFYFDDITWTIRYLVVETGGWLSGRKVLIATQAINGIDTENETFPVTLTQEQVKNSPDIDTQQTVSRQHEIDLYKHYPWTQYWSGGLWAAGAGTVGMMVGSPVSAEEGSTVGADQGQMEESHLRGFDNLKGYTINETDGHVGDVADLIVDIRSWKIDFLVVDTGTWLPGKKVLLAPTLIKGMDWLTSTVTVAASKEKIRHCPPYDPDKLVTDEYQQQLNAYYHQPFA